MPVERTKLRFIDPRGPYGLSPWWWLVLVIWILCVLGWLGAATN